MLNLVKSRVSKYLAVLVLPFYSLPVVAQSYIEMPETTQVPAFERESMQLDLDVPPLRERDPDPMGGPRLNIKEFRLQGLVEFPELGITRAALIKRVEAIRFGLMKENELGEWGYTEKEVSEIADLMAEIEGDIEDAHVGSVEVQRLVFLIREQRRNRGVTLGMVENVADVITQFYREKGFILAKAYIPEQKVRDGIVTLTLLLGELGEVDVLNAKRVSTSLIQRAFKPYINEPVTSKRLEEALYLVNDIPGLSARSVLSPGKQVGDTLLSVNTQEEKWLSGNVRVDNLGSESTSRNRLYADLFIHNPSGLGDEVYLAVLQSFLPAESTFGAFRYSSFWGLPRFRSSFGVSTNAFRSQNNASSTTVSTGFDGESQVMFGSMEYVFSRLRVKNLSAELKYSDIKTTLNVSENYSAGDSGSILSAKFKYDLLNEKLRQVYIGSVGINVAETKSESFTNAELTNYYLSADLTMLTFLKIPFTEKRTRVLFTTAMQYGGEAMSSLSQLTLTGAGRTRVFAVNGAQSDDGITASLDWIVGMPSSWNMNVFGKPLNKIVQPYLFADWAYGVKYSPALGQDKLENRFIDAGLGFKVNHGKWNADFYAGKVMLDESSDSENDNKTPTNSVSATISYSY